MNILVFGDNLKAEWRPSTLELSEMNLTYAATLDEAIELVLQGNFDLVMVDSRIENLEEVCNQLYDLHQTPVVVMVKNSQAEWKKLITVNADAFLSYTDSDYELLARIRAITRRSILNRKSSGQNSYPPDST